MADWIPSNLDLQEMIQDQSGKAATKRQAAADYHHRHLERVPEPGTIVDFEREDHERVVESLIKEAEAYERTAAQFRTDLLARQRGQTPPPSSSPAPSSPQLGPDNDVDRLLANMEKRKAPDPPAPKPAESPSETKSRSR